MNLGDFRKLTKNISADSEIVFFPEGTVESDDTETMLPGIGVYDMTDHELVYIGDVTVVTSTDEED